MAKRTYLVPIDLTQQELQNAVIQNLAAAPGSPVEGQLYYDTVAHKLYWRSNSAWVDATGGSVSFAAPTAETTFGTSSATGSAGTVPHSDHTHGNPTHVGSDHSAIKLSDLGGSNATDIPLNSHKLTGVSDPSGPQDAATKAYVDALSQGVGWKAPVRVASTANITIASALTNGSTIDGVTVATGDRVLLKNQTAPAENGIYLVVASGAASRSTDADSAAEILQAAVFVEEGTAAADTSWVNTTNAAITLNTTGLTFVQFAGPGAVTAGNGLSRSGSQLSAVADTGISVSGSGIAIDHAVVPKIYTTLIGDGSTTAIAVTHNLGTTAVVIQVFKVSDGTQVEPDITRTSTTVATITFAVAPASNAYRVVVLG